MCKHRSVFWIYINRAGQKMTREIGVSQKFVAKSADIRSQIAQLLGYSQKWVNTLWKEDVLTISVRVLWAQQFAIEIDQSYEKLWKFQKSQFSRKFQNLRFDTSISIANCSAHRSPTEMSLYFLELSGQHLSIEYWLISVRGLWAKQLTKLVRAWEAPPPR